jgi:hypothetical protein
MQTAKTRLGTGDSDDVPVAVVCSFASSFRIQISLSIDFHSMFLGSNNIFSLTIMHHVLSHDMRDINALVVVMFMSSWT